MTIERGTRDLAPAMGDIVMRSFFEKGDAPEGFADVISPMFEFPGAITYAVKVNGKLVAAAAGLVIPEHRIFALFGAGTLRHIGDAASRPRSCAPACGLLAKQGANTRSSSRKEARPQSAIACAWAFARPTARRR